MFKNRLQELCQSRKWALPQYTTTRNGPVHDPAFCASVNVNGAQFHSTEPARSSKSAQDMAARVAFEQLSSASPPPTSPPVLAIDNQVSYKSQLQNYAQKRNKDLPIYNSILEGPSHAPRFKAIVTIDGQNYYSEEYCDSLKGAEQAAAKVALMSLPVDGDKQDDSGHYKCLLQELTQKEGFSLPKYNTVLNGISGFSSVVEIENECFKGDIAKTKKQAEVNAAKVALNHLEERRARRAMSGFAIASREQVEIEPAAADLESTVSLESQKLISLSTSAHAKGGMKDDLDADIVQSVKLPVENIELNIEGLLAPVQNSHSLAADQNDINLDAGKSEDGKLSNCTIPALDTAIERCSLLCNRVQVYPTKPDRPLPECATLLPFSDEMWVAVSYDDLNQK